MINAYMHPRFRQLGTARGLINRQRYQQPQPQQPQLGDMRIMPYPYLPQQPDRRPWAERKAEAEREYARQMQTLQQALRDYDRYSPQDRARIDQLQRYLRDISPDQYNPLALQWRMDGIRQREWMLNNPGKQYQPTPEEEIRSLQLYLNAPYRPSWEPNGAPPGTTRQRQQERLQQLLQQQQQVHGNFGWTPQQRPQQYSLQPQWPQQRPQQPTPARPTAWNQGQQRPAQPVMPSTTKPMYTQPPQGQRPQLQYKQPRPPQPIVPSTIKPMYNQPGATVTHRDPQQAFQQPKQNYQQWR